jgi:hypothetical protein
MVKGISSKKGHLSFIGFDDKHLWRSPQEFHQMETVNHLTTKG